VVRHLRRTPVDGGHHRKQPPTQHEGREAVTLWEAAIETLLLVEGGYANHPLDKGGETNYGISKRSYPHLNIKTLTREQAAAIYHADYWTKIPHALPDDLRWMAFDFAVNSGVRRAMTELDASDTLASYTGKRLSFLAGLSNWGTFGRGWTNRISHVLSAIRAWQEAHPVDDLQHAETLVLHNLKIADRWVAVSKNPVVLRGEFAYRVRAGKLDVRREG
jgi:lysozyme family protein